MKDIPIDDINYILNHEQTVIDGYNQDSIETEFELTSQDFLKFSESDLISESVHKYINALSNAKRALDCQLDTLLIGFGYYKITKDKNLGFPAKITFLKEVGIITPRILSKINKTRNLMEHEFIAPNSEKVEDFIDVVSLFIAATDSYIFNLFTFKEFLFETEREFTFSNLSIKINYKESKLEIKISGCDFNRSPITEIEIPSSHPKYKEVLKAYFKVTNHAGDH